MDTEKNTVPESQQGGGNNNGKNKFTSKIIAVGRWIMTNSGDILKLTGSFAAVAGTVIVAGHESRMSAVTLMSQREQAESELRANMFSHLITPVAGPHKEGVIDSHRERVLVELLALNFHEHFEFKPLLLHVDNRLSKECGHHPHESSESANTGDHSSQGIFSEVKKTQRPAEAEAQAEADRDSLRSIARRVAARQLSALLKEGFSEPVTLDVRFGNREKSALGMKDFGNNTLIEKLTDEGIIEKLHDLYTFNSSLTDQEALKKELENFSDSEIETTKTAFNHPERRGELSEKHFDNNDLIKKLKEKGIILWLHDTYTFKSTLTDQEALKKELENFSDSEIETTKTAFNHPERRGGLSEKHFDNNKELLEKLTDEGIIEKLNDLYTFKSYLTDMTELENKLKRFSDSEIKTTIHAWQDWNTFEDQEDKRGLGEEHFYDKTTLTARLKDKGIIVKIDEDRYSFESSFTDQKILAERLSNPHFSKSEKETTIKEWQARTTSDITQLSDQLTIPLKKVQYARLFAPKSRKYFFPTSSPFVLDVAVLDVDWENETVEVEIIVQNFEDQARNQVAPQSFTLTWYDFPLTDNTILPDGERFSVILSDMDGNEDDGSVQLKVVWFPKDYFTARERPMQYKEFRETLGL